MVLAIKLSIDYPTVESPYRNGFALVVCYSSVLSPRRTDSIPVYFAAKLTEEVHPAKGNLTRMRILRKSLSEARPFLKESWALGWPMILIMFFHFSVGITDVYVAGFLGKEVFSSITLYGL